MGVMLEENIVTICCKGSKHFSSIYCNFPYLYHETFRNKMGVSLYYPGL